MTLRVIELDRQPIIQNDSLSGGRKRGKETDRSAMKKEKWNERGREGGSSRDSLRMRWCER